MRLLSKTLWFLAFLAATFSWMVLFEHGFSVKSFTQGAREEWRALVTLVLPEKSPADGAPPDKTSTRP